MIVFSDLHLRESSEDPCFTVLDVIRAAALGDDRRVVFCGDFWHIRHQLPVKLLNRVVTTMREWSECGIQADFLPGNHDQVDTAGENALEVLSAVGHRVHSVAGSDGAFGWVPYRKDFEEQRDALVAVRRARPSSGYIFGHFGVVGADLGGGRLDQEGQPDLGGPELPVDPEIAGQTLVLGHYHTPQAKDGYIYVGSPYQQNFAEAGKLCRYLRINGEGIISVEIEAGTPRYYELHWDPREGDPPKNPGNPADFIRVNVSAEHSQIVDSAWSEALAKAGLGEAQISVIPVQAMREHKFALCGGERLSDAVKRFAEERAGGDVQLLEDAVDALGRWL